jgi:hypothetical protein
MMKVTDETLTAGFTAAVGCIYAHEAEGHGHDIGLKSKAASSKTSMGGEAMRGKRAGSAGVRPATQTKHVASPPALGFASVRSGDEGR